MRRYLAVVLALAACDNWVTGPGLPATEFRFTVSGSDGHAPPPVVTPAAGGITVDGTIITADPCFEAAARVEQALPTITITVSAHSTGGVCTAVLGALAYHVRVPASTGAYELVVRQTIAGTATIDTVVHEGVDVP
jgi:hypothetical protein